MNINWRIIIPIVLLLIYALELADKLMKMNMEKAIMVAVSLLLYISACCANVFAGGDRNPGWAYLLGGWIEIFLVKWPSKLFYMAWLANIAYGFSINMYLSGKNTSLLYVLIIVSILLAMLPLFFNNPIFVDPERGIESTLGVFHLSTGYYLWIGSFLTLLLGEIVLFVLKNKIG